MTKCPHIQTQTTHAHVNTQRGEVLITSYLGFISVYACARKEEGRKVIISRIPYLRIEVILGEA